MRFRLCPRRSDRASLGRTMGVVAGALLAAVPLGAAAASGSTDLVAVVRDAEGQLSVQHVAVAASTQEAAVERLEARPDVVAADVDVPTRLLADTRQSEQWSLDVLDAEDAWRRSTGDGVVVGVLDTGVDAGHPDLRGQVARGTDTTGGGTDGRSDPHGHGTHVAGVVAAARDGRGVVGLAPDATVLPVRVLDSSGAGKLSQAAAGILWAVDHGADVVTLSLGASRSTAVLDAAVAHAVAKDVLVIAATGNDGASRAQWPAAHPDVLSVGATGSDGRVASFSNGDPSLDLVAPGVRVLSTCTGARWCLMSGTSMATPSVAAAAALVRARQPALSASEVRRALSRTAADVAPAGHDLRAGHGRLVPVAALRSADAAMAAKPDAFSTAARLGRVGTGADPSAIAVAASRAAFPGGAETAVLARDDVFADSLTGAALAGARGPVLFTPGGPTARLGAAPAAELRRVLPPGSTVLVLGGPDAVSPATAADVERLGFRARRIAGADRVATAVAVADEVAGTSPVDRVLLARADHWADAVTGSAYAAASRVPVLLTASARLDDRTRDWLVAHDAAEVVVLGGPAAVSDRAAEQAARHVDRLQRVGGANRADTAARVARQLWGRRTASDDDAFVVVEGWTPRAWAPAVAAASLSATGSGPQLLVAADEVPGATQEYLRGLGYGGARGARVTAVGGLVGSAVGYALLPLLGGAAAP